VDLNSYADLAVRLANSIRYAVRYAVGRQAACAKDKLAGLGTRLRRGTATLSANVPS